MTKIIKNYLSSFRASLRFLSCTYLLFFVVACSDKTNHEVLTFFFTGIPDDKGQVLVGNVDDQVFSSVGRQGAITPRRSSHSFYISKKCEECHLALFIRTFGDVKPSKQPVRVLGKSDVKLENSYVVSCERCHTKLSSNYTRKNNLWRHAPISKGNCTVCHFPHQSKQSFLLKDTSERLCIMCHSEGNIRRNKNHKTLKDCMSCHNPHLGKNKNLLLSDYNERAPRDTQIIVAKDP